MKWFLRACPECGGDLHEDLEEEEMVTCFLCSRSFPRDQAIPRIGPGTRARRGHQDEELRPAA